jgi:8-oxo-dGTP pyrophosphatase MutT (NUDIX family)
MNKNDFYCADGASVVILKWSNEQNCPSFLLVQRRDTGIFELPGGGVEYDLDLENDAFIQCAIREVKQETGLSLCKERTFLDAVLRQRVLKPIRMFGSLHLFHYQLNSTSDVIDETFTGEETQSIRFFDLVDIDFSDPSISLATKRMILIFMDRYDDQAVVVGDAPFIGWLGKPFQYGDICV